jgi:hypothetical protein
MLSLDPDKVMTILSIPPVVILLLLTIRAMYFLPRHEVPIDERPVEMGFSVLREWIDPEGARAERERDDDHR